MAISLRALLTTSPGKGLPVPDLSGPSLVAGVPFPLQASIPYYFLACLESHSHPAPWQHFLPQSVVQPLKLLPLAHTEKRAYASHHCDRSILRPTCPYTDGCISPAVNTSTTVSALTVPPGSRERHWCCTSHSSPSPSPDQLDFVDLVLEARCTHPSAWHRTRRRTPHRPA